MSSDNSSTICIHVLQSRRHSDPCWLTSVMSQQYSLFKGAVCRFRDETFKMGRKNLHWQIFFYLNKLYKLSLFSWLNFKKKTDLKEKHSFILFCFVYMWRTLPPWHDALDLIFSACLFAYGKNKYFWLWIITLSWRLEFVLPHLHLLKHFKY